MLCIAFGRTVSAEQTILEIDSHLGYDGIAVLIFGSRYLNRRQQVLLRIAAQHTHRQLTTREHHRLA